MKFGSQAAVCLELLGLVNSLLRLFVVRLSVLCFVAFVVVVAHSL